MKFAVPPLWFLVTLAFIILLGAWGGLIVAASKNRPEAVPLQNPPAHTQP